MNEYVPSLISNAGRVLPPVLRDLDQLQMVEDLHAASADGTGMAGVAAETLSRKPLNVLIADPHPVVLAGVTALLAST